MRARWTKRRADLADLLLAASVAFAAAASALTGSSDVPAGGETSIVGDRYLVAAVYAAAGLLLVFRRRAPFTVFLCIVGLLSLPVLVWGSSEGFGAFVALLVAVYSVGAHCERQPALVAPAVLTVFWGVFEARDPLNHDVGDILGSWPVYLLFLLAWVGGSYFRARRLYLAELRTRAERAESTQAERVRVARADERTRIARELHDAVAHTMTVMVMQAEAADEVFISDPNGARSAIRRVQQAGREGLAEMRRLVDILRQDEANERFPQPGLASLPELVDTIRETGLDVEVTIEGTPVALPVGIDISAYRIVQEALTNAIKHAGATLVNVTVSYDDGLAVEITDNGAGHNGTPADGHGLAGMRERIDLYGGTLQIGAAEGGGFRVRATMPAPAAA